MQRVKIYKEAWLQGTCTCIQVGHSLQESLGQHLQYLDKFGGFLKKLNKSAKN